MEVDSRGERNRLGRVASWPMNGSFTRPSMTISRGFSEWSEQDEEEDLITSFQSRFHQSK